MTENMNDRELLEFAAKAAYGDFGGQMVSGGWSPLENDGDALPLAVELNMSIEIDAFNGDTLVIVNDAVGSPLVIINQKHLGDPCKATRRAITRAAAEIGRKM